VTGVSAASEDRLWPYLIVSVVLLQLASALAWGTYFALVPLVEWSLALSILRQLQRAGGSAIDLIAPEHQPWRFRWLPAVVILVGVNAIMDSWTFGWFLFLQ
jgi:hypothetical protein